MSVPAELAQLSQQIRLLQEDQRQARIEAARERERARSIKLIKFQGTLPALSAGAAPVLPDATPAPGYVWGLRLLGLNLVSASNARVWIASDNSGNLPAVGAPVGASPSSTFDNFTWSGVQAVMRDGEYLGISTAGAVVAGSSFTLFALEVAAEEIWKII